MLKLLWMDLGKALQDIPLNVFAFTGSCAVVLLALRSRIEKRFDFWKILQGFAFIIYLYAVIHTTFLCRLPDSRVGISLIPGATWGNSAQSHAYVIENILMTIPFGWFLARLWKPMQSWKRCIVTAAGLSIMIEVIQLATGRGYFQVDDILTNVFGAWLGCMIGKILNFCKQH